jgi:hypothetical protein
LARHRAPVRMSSVSKDIDMQPLQFLLEQNSSFRFTR